LQIKNRQQILIAAAVAVVALFALDKIVISPLTAAWRERSKSVSELRNRVANGRSLVGRERSLRNHWAEMQTNALPANRSLAEQKVLDSFNRWAQDSRLTITSVSPQWRDQEDYSTLQCRVEGSGNLERVTQFLHKMEKDPMALRLETVELSSRDTEGQQISLAMQVSGLVLGGNGKNAGSQ
jgi:Tfp pilus assembly protein PilO